MTNNNTQTGERYIHDIKELPEDIEETVPVEQKVSVNEKNTTEVIPEETDNDIVTDAESEEYYEETNEKVVSAKEGILIGINIVSVILLAFLLFKLPQEAKKIHDLRVSLQKSDNSQSFEFTEIAAAKEKTDKLKSLFLNDEGIVQFVSSVESLKEKTPSVTRIEFPAQEASKDKTGNMVIPVIIELSGTWQEVGDGFSEIEALPYLFRAASIDVKQNKEDQGKVDVKYGGVLYVNEQIPTAKNR